MTKKNSDIEDRIQLYVDFGLPEDQCWPWSGPTTRYKHKTQLSVIATEKDFEDFDLKAVFGHPSPKVGCYLPAQAVMWALLKGTEVGEGNEVVRTCGSKTCVNPSHHKVTRRK